MTTPSAILDFSADVHTIEQSFVAESSNTSYRAKISHFMVWLYDNHRSYLSDDYTPMMDELHDEDVKRRQSQQEQNQQYPPINRQNSTNKSKSRGRNKKKSTQASSEEDRSSLRSYCLALLHNVKPDVERTSHNSPIKIEGDSALTYSLVRDYMMTKKKIVQVDRDVAQAYLCSKLKKKDAAIPDECISSNGTVNVLVQQSSSSYSGVRSAIVHLYTMARVPMPKKMSDEFSKFIAGQVRTGLNEKQELGLKLRSGKKPMTAAVFELIARALFESNQHKHIFTHLFFVLDW